MKPTVCIASAATPHGARLDLVEHDGDFSFRIGVQELMSSRAHQSELDLADLGCSRLRGVAGASVLIGGLGMGFTLSRAETLLAADSRITVAELLPDVVEWNRTRIGHLAGHPLQDPRVDLVVGDVFRVLRASSGKFDAILMDTDNGPEALTHPGNRSLYSPDGLAACRRALRDDGLMAVWSAAADKRFESRLLRAFGNSRRYRAPAYPGSRTQSRFIFVAASHPRLLPAGGGAPRPSRAPLPVARGFHGRGKRPHS